MITLLDKIKSDKQEKRTNYEITPEIIELALAWQKDEVTIGQIEKVLNIHVHNKIYAILARALKQSAKPIESQKKPTKIMGPINPNYIVPGKPPVWKEEKKNTIKPIRKASDEAPSKY